jgi:glycine C-acetyltransferase
MDRGFISEKDSSILIMISITVRNSFTALRSLLGIEADPVSPLRFGMAGDLGKLDKIAALKKKYNFRFLVDDAHGFGTMGANGRGTGEHFGVQDQIDVYFATFAKSMAGIGGFVASSKEVINYLRYNLRSQIYAKALPMAMTLGAIKRLEILQAHPEYRENLWTIVRALQKV